MFQAFISWCFQREFDRVNLHRLTKVAIFLAMDTSRQSQ